MAFLAIGRRRRVWTAILVTVTAEPCDRFPAWEPVRLDLVALVGDVTDARSMTPLTSGADFSMLRDPPLENLDDVTAGADTHARSTRIVPRSALYGGRGEHLLGVIAGRIRWTFLDIAVRIGLQIVLGSPLHILRRAVLPDAARGEHSGHGEHSRHRKHDDNSNTLHAHRDDQARHCLSSQRYDGGNQDWPRTPEKCCENSRAASSAAVSLRLNRPCRMSAA